MVVAPLAAGELVVGSAVVATDDAAPFTEITLSVAQSRAAYGRFERGTAVDVYSTLDEARTVRLVEGAVVLSIATSGDGVLADDTGQVTVRLQLPTYDVVPALVHAQAEGDLTLVPAGDTDGLPDLYAVPGNDRTGDAGLDAGLDTDRTAIDALDETDPRSGTGPSDDTGSGDDTGSERRHGSGRRHEVERRRRSGRRHGPGRRRRHRTRRGRMTHTDPASATAARRSRGR